MGRNIGYGHRERTQADSDALSALLGVAELSCDLLQPSCGNGGLSRRKAPGQLSGAGAPRQAMGGPGQAFRSSSAGQGRPWAGSGQSWRAPGQALGALKRLWAGFPKLFGRPGACLGRPWQLLASFRAGPGRPDAALGRPSGAPPQAWGVPWAAGGRKGPKSKVFLRSSPPWGELHGSCRGFMAR